MTRPLAAVALVVLPALAFAADPPDSTRWEADVAKIEKRLAEKPPAKGGVVFAGSSSIVKWDLGKWFPDRNVTNVGFGGSEVRDSTHYAARLVLPLEPTAVVFYAGDNDLAQGRTPAQVRDDFKAFEKAVHDKLPKARILFVAVKPSPKRWALYGKQTEANALVKEACGADDRLAFVDVVPAMLGPDGKPAPELFVADGLHLSDKGYELWTGIVNKALGK